MRRSLPTAAVAVAMASALLVSGCASKGDSGGGGGGSTSGSSASSSDLSIQPVVQIDESGKEVPAADASNAADPAGDGKAKCASTTTIAMAGALTGPNAALGINILDGAKVAVDAHNKANADCQVQLKGYDTEGDPQKATQVAPTIVANKNVIGLLGPAFSGETAAVGDIFHQANLLSLTASATNVDLTKNGWTNFFRGLANDGVQGPAVAHYLVDTKKFTKVCVVQDDSDYGVGLAKAVTSALGSAADKDCAASVKTGDKDFSATVQIVKDAGADAVFYAGYYAEASPFVSQLRSSGVDATFVSADGTNDPEFVKQAGSSSKDALLSCPCGPAPDQFATDYKSTNDGRTPGVYSVEGYDLATIMLKGIDSGITDRAKLVDYVKNYSGDGLARHYQWGSTGELSSALIWIYQVK